MKNQIKVISFNELNASLKEMVITNFQESEFLVPEDWYEWLLEGLSETYKFVTIDSESVEFDMYRGDLEYNGEIDMNHKTIKQYLTDEYLEWNKKEWLYDFPTNFESTELSDEFYIDRNLIFEELEGEIFNNEDLIVVDGKVTIPISVVSSVEKAIKDHKELDSIKFLKEILNLINVAELFFQNEIVVEEDEYDDFMYEISTEMEIEIESTANDIIDSINSELSEVYDNYKFSLQNAYNHYYTVEYAEENLSDRKFEIEFDENGNQLEVIDLNGEW